MITHASATEFTLEFIAALTVDKKMFTYGLSMSVSSLYYLFVVYTWFID